MNKITLVGRSVNKITLVGTVGCDPDICQTSDGTKEARFSLATKRQGSSGSNEEERTDWHRLSLMDRQAQFAENNIKSGDRIYVEGSLEYDSYERHDGVVIPTSEVKVREIVLLRRA